MKRWLACLLVALFLLAGCGADKAPEETGTPDPALIGESPAVAEETDIEEMAVSLVSDMTNGEFDKVVSDYPFSPEMKSAITDGQFIKDQMWDPLISAYGEFSEITGTLASEHQGFDIISVKTSFEKTKLYINVVFDSDKQVAGLNFNPDPDAVAVAPPEGMTESDITFGKKDWELPGTLTRPAGDGPFPVVILVHGSGPNDRDETMGPNAPFRDIAMGLAQRGIATLRYDKRTYVHQQKIGSIIDATVYDETVEDAVLAVEYLKADDSIDQNHIFILGHSLGGMLIPRIAEMTPDAAGYVIMAGSVSPMEDMVVEQVRYLSELDGTVTDQEEQVIQAYETMRDNVKALTSESDTSQDQLFGIPVSYWLDLRGYQPANEAKNIEKPLLILQGERDYQVTMDEFELWKDALEPQENVLFKTYEGLNHLMIYGTGDPSPEEYMIPGHVEDQVIDDIASWLGS